MKSSFESHYCDESAQLDHMITGIGQTYISPGTARFGARSAIAPYVAMCCNVANAQQHEGRLHMTTPPRLFFEDVEIGMTFKTGSVTIDAASIRSFASKFDPQPYHLDRDAADASLFGGLCASGWHVCALMMRMLSDCVDDAGLKMIGNDNVPWLKWRMPVFENDRLHAVISIAACRHAEDDPNQGEVVCDVDVLNQDDKTVMSLNTVLQVARRGMPEAEGARLS